MIQTLSLVIIGTLFEDFHYSPFIIQQESDVDDATMTAKQFKELNTKLDYLLESSKDSSRDEYSQTSVKAFLEMLTKEHASNLAFTNKSVVDSTQTCKDRIEKSHKTNS